MDVWSTAWRPDRLQQVRKVATCPKAKPQSSGFGDQSPCGQIEVRQAPVPPWPSAWSKLRRRPKLQIFPLPLLLFRQNAGKQTLLTAASSVHHEVVFALSVEKIRPMAGRPVWRSLFLGSCDILGISRGYIQLHTMLFDFVCHPILMSWNCRANSVQSCLDSIASVIVRPSFPVLRYRLEKIVEGSCSESCD